MKKVIKTDVLLWLGISLLLAVRCGIESSTPPPLASSITNIPTATPTFSSATPTPTLTLTLIATSTPTIPPTSTPAATLTPSEPMQRITHTLEQVELALPATYQIFDVADIPVDDTTDALSESCQAVLEESEITNSGILLAAVDTESFSSGVPAVFLLVEESFSPPVPIEVFLQRLQLCDDLQITESEVISMKGMPVGRVVIESTMFGISMKQVSYIFQQDNRLWTLSHTIGTESYEQQLPIFQLIAESFTILSK